MSVATPPLPPPAAPGSRWRYFTLAVGLAAALAGFLIWNNVHYLFHARLYEDGDPAANSLSVLRAEHFQELYGAYSRWMFHHPGPALFYSFALGEWLLYRTFHLVPTPYNAQVLIVMVLTASFFAAGVGVAARWVRGTLFVPLAVLLAALHFTAVNPYYWGLIAWPPFVVPMIFFALLMAAASVGAGQGDDLPLLVLAGGFMVHGHVAQPLFVGPLCLFAYGGLAWACLRRGTDTARRTPPWRVFPRAHRFAAVLAAAFALPLLVDLCLGSRSNFAQILLHLRTHHGLRQPWLDALYCFLRFGTYTPTTAMTTRPISPGNVSGAQIGAFLLGHAKMTALWLGALLLPPVAATLRRRETRPAAIEHAPDTPAPAGMLPPSPPGRWRYLGSLGFFWLLTAGLTVVWNHLQDGEMFYYNSWFTYATYYALALLAAGAASDLVETRVLRPGRARVWTALAAALCLLAAGGYLARRLGHYREHDYDNDLSRAGAHSVETALAAHADDPRTKLLLFPQRGWERATAVAALLTRWHQPWVVPADWAIMFGDEHAPATLFSTLASAAGGRLPYDVWFLVPADTVDPAVAARFPLIGAYTLLLGGRELDPADAAITFVGKKPNADLFLVTGWSTVDAADVPYLWSVGPVALFSFLPRPVPPGAVVEIACDFADTFLVPGKRESQRLTLRFNGTDLGTQRVDAAGPRTLRLEIPAAVWNARPTAILAMDFPDAISPLQAGLSADFRPLAFAARTITFHVRTAPAPPAAP